LAVLAVGGSLAAAAELSEKFSKRIDSAEAAYQQAVAKADNTRFYAVQKANSDRVKALKQALTDATKAGDFDAATAIKERISEAERTGPREKPKNTIKFGGHEYAMITDPATWHVAKQRCEEMGGHLAVIDNADENARLLALCREAKVAAWVGATDEATEGQWRWVTGTKCNLEFTRDNANDSEHSLAFWMDSGRFEDLPGSGRYAFVCEWED
jgi:hypothetical protein